MAITKIKTHNSASKLINYVKDIDPKDKNKVRVLGAKTKNCSFANAKNDFKKSRKKRKVDCYQVITSYDLDELDPDNEEDVQLALEHTSETINQQFGEGCQYLLVAQADGKGGRLHVHAAINNYNLLNGNAFRSRQTSWINLSNISDRQLDVMNIKNKNKNIKEQHTEYFDTDYVYKSTFAEMYSAEDDDRIQHNQNKKYSFKNDIEQIIDNIFDKYLIESDTDYENALDQYNIKFRKTGQGEKTKYSYHFIDELGKNRKVRENKLTNENYGYSRLRKEIYGNQEKEESRINRIGARESGAERIIEQVDEQQQKINRAIRQQQSAIREEYFGDKIENGIECREDELYIQASASAGYDIEF